VARLVQRLREALLNRTSEEYLSHLTGGESYWQDEVQFISTIQAGDSQPPLDYYQPAQSPARSPA
jgi:hypothetical protein